MKIEQKKTPVGTEVKAITKLCSSQSTPRVTDFQAINLIGKEAARELILNALRERNEQLKEAEEWVHISEVCIEKVNSWVKAQKVSKAAAIGLLYRAHCSKIEAEAQVERLLKAYNVTRSSHRIVDKETIKNNTDIVDLISGYVELRPRGRDLWGICPFHQEKTPSFKVSPDRQNWYCFGENMGGDVFTFVMKQEGCSFPEALKKLGEQV